MDIIRFFANFTKILIHTANLMKSMNNSKELGQKNEGMTLMDYYESIPVAPRTDFLLQISEKCGVDINTARNWVKGRFTPKNEVFRKTISEITGIKQESLFAN